MRRIVLLAAVAAAVAAAPALADHLHASPSVTVAPLQPPRPPIDFSPAPDPFAGAFRGMVQWDVGCPGGERFGYSIEFVDYASGTWGLPPEVARKRSTSVFWFKGSGYDTRPAGQAEVRIPAGTAVYPRMQAVCYLYSTNSHESERVAVDGPPVIVPPYLWYPVVKPVASRTLSAATKPTILKRGQAVEATIRVAAAPKEKETVRLFVAGAGVKVERRYAPARARGAVSIRFRPTKRGVVRLWAVLQPYGKRSNVVGLRVR